MRAGKVAGVQVVLNNWFLALIIVFYLAGMADKLFVVFLSVLWHELNHALVACLLGFKVSEVELLPFGGVARIQGLNEAGTRDEILIAIAGPISSCVLAILSYMGKINLLSYQELFAFILDINTMLMVFNLLPALPLDGGRIVRALLADKLGYSKATLSIAKLTHILCLGLIIITAYDIIMFQAINMTFIVAAIFLYCSAGVEIKVASFRTMRILAQRKAELTATGVMSTMHLTVLPTVLLKDILHSFKAEYYYIILIIDGKFHLCGAVTETEIWDNLPEKGIYTKIGDFL